MIFKLHYWFIASGANALGILLGVFMEAYTDASSTEIGMLYMSMPFIGIFCRPLICSLADRKQAHREYIMLCQFVVAITYLPFVIIPLLGPQAYEAHPRLCFYTLVSLKVLGDAAFGGVISIGDSLAINYAKRIGVEFSVYRVWGTISWMVFGVIIGQVNEIWFLPKYVPGILVLIVSSLLNMFVVYLWPPDYFKMVPHIEGQEKKQGEAISSDLSEKMELKKENAMTKSLMPRELVWAHAKKQIWNLITFRCLTNTLNSTQIGEIKTGGAGTRDETSKVAKEDFIDRRTQLKILGLLMRRDPRIVLYLLMFICAGFSIIPLSFLFISLAQICHQDNRCNFSQLGGLLQVSMALAETILFIYIKRIIAAIGRLNTISISFFLTTLKFLFYGTIWLDVDPYYSLVIELFHGIIFGIYLTLMVEMGHLFANEVDYVIPELIEKEIIPRDSDREKLKLSLLATMQAIIANANDGLGRGIGALVYGLILDHYTFTTLWRCIAVGSTVVFIVIQIVNITDRYMHFNLGASLVKRGQNSNGVQARENGNVDRIKGSIETNPEV